MSRWILVAEDERTLGEMLCDNLTLESYHAEHVTTGPKALERMARGGEMEMMAQMAQADLQRVTVGTRAVVTPVGSNQSVNGQVWQVSPVIDPQTRQGMVRIAVPYTAALRPGGFADARLLSGSYYGQTVQIWAALFAAAIVAAGLVALIGVAERGALKRMGMAR